MQTGLNVASFEPKYRKYHVERLPVLISGFDKPETSEDEDQDQESCNGIHSDCSECQEVRNEVLAETTETDYLSDETSIDLEDIDSSHDGEYSDCSDCEKVRKNKCINSACTDHGAGDSEGYEGDPPKDFEDVLNDLLEGLRGLRLIEPEFRRLYPCDGVFDINWLQNRSTVEKLEEYENCYAIISKMGLAERWKFPDPNWIIHEGLKIPMIPKTGNPVEADDAVKEFIENLQKETEIAMQISNNIAASAIDKLKASNDTTRRIKTELQKSMIKEEEICLELSGIFNLLTAQYEQAEKTKAELEMTKAELEKELIEAKIDKIDMMTEEVKKWYAGGANQIKINFDVKTGKIKDFNCLNEVVKKQSNCSCSKEDMEKARMKIKEAIRGLKNAIQMTGGKVKGTNNPKEYMHNHKSAGKRLYVIIQYVVGLPGIDNEALEITKNVFWGKKKIVQLKIRATFVT